jgi:hypothetical protein
MKRCFLSTVLWLQHVCSSRNGQLWRHFDRLTMSVISEVGNDDAVSCVWQMSEILTQFLHIVNEITVWICLRLCLVVCILPFTWYSWGAGSQHSLLWLGYERDAPQEIFRFSKGLQIDLGSTQSSLTWIAATLFHSRGMKLTTDLHLAPRLRVSGTIPPLPHMPTWRVKEQLYLLYFSYKPEWPCVIEVSALYILNSLTSAIPKDVCKIYSNNCYYRLSWNSVCCSSTHGIVEKWV